MKTAMELSSSLTALLLMAPQRRRPMEQDLTSYGMRLITARDCQEAQCILRQFPRGVHVIVTDVSLSDGNWCDIVREVVDAGAAVLVCTKEHHPRLYDEVVRRGACYLILEPYHPKTLQLTMWAAVARHRPLRDQAETSPRYEQAARRTLRASRNLGNGRGDRRGPCSREDAPANE